MENFDEPLDARQNIQSPTELELTEGLVRHWLSISSWAMFFSILLFLACAIVLIWGYLTLKVTPTDELGVVLFYLPFAAALFVPGLLLWLFQSKLKKAFYEESPELLENSFRAFRHFYLLAAILSITGIVLYIGILVTALLTAPAAGTMPEQPSY
ncbi:MAG: hypothetical protein H7246_10425 [Phycisphaerae bacterium]|nr:hypothetical protein [Saprospiraceae bacterium]